MKPVKLTRDQAQQISRALNAAQIRELIVCAQEAQEAFDVDELELFALERRRTCQIRTNGSKCGDSATRTFGFGEGICDYHHELLFGRRDDRDLPRLRTDSPRFGWDRDGDGVREGDFDDGD